jgi:predicted RNA-binding protein with PUA-like domain
VTKQYWLMKTEPDEFSIADLERVKIEPWSGVRNFMARFNMRAMNVGDEVLFHHSSVDPPGVAGLARVQRTNVIDEKQFDPKSKYCDPRATREKPIWDCVDVEYVATFPHFVSMDRMRREPALADMAVLKRGMRLSVQPVTEAEYNAVVALGNTEPPPEPEKPKPVRAAKPKGRPNGSTKPRRKAGVPKGRRGSRSRAAR